MVDRRFTPLKGTPVLRVKTKPGYGSSSRCSQALLAALGVSPGAVVAVALSADSKLLTLCLCELQPFASGESSGVQLLLELPKRSYTVQVPVSQSPLADTHNSANDGDGVLLWAVQQKVAVAASIVICSEGGATGPSLSCISATARKQISLDMRGAIVLPGCRFNGIANLAHSLIVVRTVPSQRPVLFTRATRITITPATSSLPDKSACANATLGGSSGNIVMSLQELVLQPLLHVASFAAFHALRPPSGILLRGPPGVGKTYAVRQLMAMCATQLPSKLFVLGGPMLSNRALGETERRMREVFENAQNYLREHAGQPCLSIVFIDEIDALCPHRGRGGSMEDRVVAQLLTLMDGLRGPSFSAAGSIEHGRLVVIGATNRPDAIDSAIRRPGRFERELECRPPDPSQRAMILSNCCSSFSLASDVQLDAIAAECVGYVGADLAALAREAALGAVRRRTVPFNDDRVIAVTRRDFEDAQALVGASSLRRSGSVLRPLAWEDVGGLHAAKRKLREVVEWPSLHGDALRRFGIRSARGVLLHGPPGCSKTSLVRAAASSVHSSFFSLSSADVYSPYVGETERAIRNVFAQARAALPAMVFFDEIDVIVGGRELPGSTGGGGASGVQARVLSTLLNEMDGVEHVDGLLVMGATNRIDAIDAALLRPGRFDVLLHVPPPDHAARIEILCIHTRDMPLADDVCLEELASMTKQRTGADLAQLCQEAACDALRGNVDVASSVTMCNFREAMRGLNYIMHTSCTSTTHPGL